MTPERKAWADSTADLAVAELYEILKELVEDTDTPFDDYLLKMFDSPLGRESVRAIIRRRVRNLVK